MKKEIPVLFNTEMVQATLDGRKKMTRRILKSSQHGWNCQNMELTHTENILTSEISKKYKRQAAKIVGVHAFFTDKEHMGHQLGIQCPFGQPGDMLWVRETWMDSPNIEMNPNEPYYFKASKSKQFIEEWPKCWRPSIHMPKEAARIWLQVEEVRVERLHAISEEDILNEGVLIPVSEKNTPCFVLGTNNSAFGFLPDGCMADDAERPTKKQILFAFFAELWCKINGRENWDANPWVWVVKFKVVSTTGKNGIIEG